MSLEPVTLFLDESGNGNPSDPLVICGIAVEDHLAADLEGRIRRAYDRVLARPKFRTDEERDRFARDGFHRSIDLPEVGAEFVSVLGTTNTYKALLIGTDRTTLPGSEVDQLVEMYVRLGSVARRQFRSAPSMKMVVETNAPLAPRLREIEDRVNSRRNSGGRRLPAVSVEQAAKSPESILAVADTFALIASTWLKSEVTADRSKFQYRTWRKAPTGASPGGTSTSSRFADASELGAVR